MNHICITTEDFKKATREQQRILIEEGTDCPFCTQAILAAGELCPAGKATAVQPRNTPTQP